MEKTATPQAKPKNKHFWNFQPASGDNPPELILYGDIASETWWGDEVTPRQFTEELDALGAAPEIVHNPDRVPVKIKMTQPKRRARKDSAS